MKRSSAGGAAYAAGGPSTLYCHAYLPMVQPEYALFVALPPGAGAARPRARAAATPGIRVAQRSETDYILDDLTWNGRVY